MPPKSHRMRPSRYSQTSKSGPRQSGRENINITLNVDDTKGSKGLPSKGSLNQGKTSKSSSPSRSANEISSVDP